MKRVMLRVAYDGTDYCGWQLQPGVATIEGVLNRELSKLLGESITVTGASRTDSGVHSLGNVAVFDTDTRIPPEKISYALNSRLPEDIVVQESREVAPDFHPRRCNSRKTYEYRILNREFPLPSMRRDSYFYHRRLDAAAMAQAAGFLVGTHDFASFCAVHTQALTTVRTIYACEVEKTGDLIVLRVTGAGFLYNMVRTLVGTMLFYASDIKDEGRILRSLREGDRDAVGKTMPAKGLVLESVDYGTVLF